MIINLSTVDEQLVISNEFEECILNRFERQLKTKFSLPAEHSKFDKILSYLSHELNKINDETGKNISDIICMNLIKRVKKIMLNELINNTPDSEVEVIIVLENSINSHALASLENDSNEDMSGVSMLGIHNPQLNHNN
jgi:hypothetical protein